MITNYLIVAGSIVTLFLMMLVGFFLKRSGKLGDETLSQITYLLLFIVTPCVEIQAFQIERTADCNLPLPGSSDSPASASQRRSYWDCSRCTR